MITIDASFWESVGVESSDGNANGNQKDFYNSMVVNGVAVNNQYDFFQNSTVNGIVYYNQWDWYKAIGTFYSEPIYDQYSFCQNVTFDGVNKVGNQKDFFEFILGIRYYSTLNGTSQYYTIPTVTLTTDFEIKFDFSTTVGGTVIGQSSQNFMRVNNDTTFDMRLGDATISTFTTSGLLNGKLNNIKVTRISGTVEVFHNSVSIGTATDTDTFKISNIGRYPSTSYFNGVISEVEIYDNSVSTDLIRYYKIDEDLSTTSTIIDSGSDGSNGTAVSITSSELFTLEGADWIGAELVVNGDFATDTVWTKGGSLTISGGFANFLADNDSLRQLNILLDGLTYKGTFDIVRTAGTMIACYNGTSGGLTVTSTGSFTNIFNGDSGLDLWFYGTTFRGTTTNVSVKRILQAPPTVEEILTDGSTVLWIDSQENITKDGADLVSLWGDKSGNGNDLVQATETNRPTWNANGILFDGVDNFMKAVAFTLVQPEFIYIVFKQVTWTSGDRILSGDNNNDGILFQSSGTIGVKANAGTSSAATTDLALDTYGIARVLFNGASSTLQINEGTQIASDFGSNDMGGFSLGADGAGGGTFSNIEVKEVIIRNVADSAQEEGTIYNYLADKYSI